MKQSPAPPTPFRYEHAPAADPAADAGPAAPGGDALVLRLLHAARVLEAELESAMADVGLSRAKYGVLAQLARAGEPLPLGELAAGQRCVRSNMTQLMDRLEADGLVRRVDDAADRRCVRAALTALGAERHAQGRRQLDRVAARFAAPLSADDRAALERVLRTVG
jgi:DNA-binding MarR family transcriptional regulator